MRIFDFEGGNAEVLESAGAVAIGNFDGVHLGHRKVIDDVVRTAQKLNVNSAVMTFEPYPREYFAPQSAPPRLTSCRQKFELLQDTGIDRIYCLRFRKRLASTLAEDFVSTILVEKLKVRHVTVGIDFRFGSKRAGDVELLRVLGDKFGFGVTAIDDYKLGKERVSSSRIRALLADGELDHAAHLLGRSFSFTGRVIHGDKRGRTWGFPTANFPVPHDSFPLKGVFVVALTDEDGDTHMGVANVGRRPTVSGLRLLIEAHLFDYSGNLYGQRANVKFLHKIRDEQKFGDFDALKLQIGKDIQSAKLWLNGVAANA